MKLNNQQITALAGKFYSELVEKTEKIKKEERTKLTEQFRANYNKGIKLLEKNDFVDNINISISKSKTATLTRNKSFESYINDWSIKNHLNEQIGVGKEPSVSNIKEDIILATIDTSSVEEIMKVLKEKYK